jgi:hypothetical protein
MSSVFARAVLGAVRGELPLVHTWLESKSEHKLNVNVKIRKAISAKDTAEDPINRKFRFKRDIKNAWGLDLIVRDDERYGMRSPPPPPL